MNVKKRLIKGLESIYIINSEGKLIFSQENNIHTSDIKRPEALSNLLSLMESIALKLGERHVSLIELGKSAIYSAFDKYNRILFILKCDKNIKRKKVDRLLKQIMHEFINKFDGNFTKSTVEKEKLMSVFIKVMNKIFGETTKSIYFIEELRIIL